MNSLKGFGRCGLGGLGAEWWEENFAESGTADVGAFASSNYEGTATQQEQAMRAADQRAAANYASTYGGGQASYDAYYANTESGGYRQPSSLDRFASAFADVFKTAAPIGAQFGSNYMQTQAAKDQQGVFAKLLSSVGVKPAAPTPGASSGGVPGWAIGLGAVVVLGLGAAVILKR